MKMLKPILTTTEKGAQEGLRKWTRATVKRARELSPTDTGASDKSGFTRIDDLTAQVGFTSLVSRLQHENLEYEHADGGQPKFLETAAAENDAAEFVANAIRDEFGSG